MVQDPERFDQARRVWVTDVFLAVLLYVNKVNELHSFFETRAELSDDSEIVIAGGGDQQSFGADVAQGLVSVISLVQTGDGICFL